MMLRLAGVENNALVVVAAMLLAMVLSLDELMEMPMRIVRSPCS